MAAMRAVGLMSGTSLDGVDAALIETDGETISVFGPTAYRPYTDAERALLTQALVDGAGLSRREDRPGVLAEAEEVVARAHAEAVEALIAENGLDRAGLDVVGFHGQTVLHRPAHGLTVQIGDGPGLARRLGLPVVYDFRAADVAAGGQGAPLVPVFHRALARSSGMALPLAILNIGGVANVTFIFSNGEMLAFDTGPGNALIDDLMRERLGAEFDDDGRVAASGAPEEPLLDWLMAHPYFASKPPKSLDRNWFSHRIAGHLATPDAAATLMAFSARAIAASLDHASEKPARWIVAGGGARNGALLETLRRHLQTHLTDAEAVGWSSGYLEAQAFAFLAVRSLRGLPLTFPGTTGAPAPLTGGLLATPE
ncbi:MAG: anhydro-N-acetylmuramic acid kinase [Salinarimonadaceae bacterium]|nr:MAG: anhydro-N-acetylmuramic acid kinase [Salinarimonadaceae bacterium]TVR10675.1 MAG: anhydro-N-acetylmuramic acid kinase [Salinarimonadaceae bacterium]